MSSLATSQPLRDQRGLSLIELVVSIAVIAALITTSAVLFSVIIKVYAKDKVGQDLQREGDTVMASISQNIKEAVSVDQANSNFTNNPNTLTFRLSNNQTRKYYVSSGQLHYVNESGTDRVILQPGTSVSSLTFTADSDQVGLQVLGVNLGLSRTKYGQTVTYTLASTINTRPQ